MQYCLIARGTRNEHQIWQGNPFGHVLNVQPYCDNVRQYNLSLHPCKHASCRILENGRGRGVDSIVRRVFVRPDIWDLGELRNVSECFCRHLGWLVSLWVRYCWRLAMRYLRLEWDISSLEWDISDRLQTLCLYPSMGWQWVIPSRTTCKYLACPLMGNTSPDLLQALALVALTQILTQDPHSAWERGKLSISNQNQNQVVS